MTMTSLKITKADRVAEKKKYDDSPCAPGMDDYGYGLRLRFGEREIDKLGIELPKVGKRMRIEAIAVVVEVSSSDRNGETNRSLELQVQKIDLDAPDDNSAEEAVEDAISK